METPEFLRKFIVDQNKKLQEQGFTFASFILMAQSIELLGAFLDSKPVKARGQSRERFSNALDQLFEGRYSRCNEGFFLYNTYRNQLVHAFYPSEYLILLAKPENDLTHLGKLNKKLVICADVLLKDISLAVEKIVQGIESGQIKNKKLPDFSDFGSYL